MFFENRLLQVGGEEEEAGRHDEQKRRIIDGKLDGKQKQTEQQKIFNQMAEGNPDQQGKQFLFSEVESSHQRKPVNLNNETHKNGEEGEKNIHACNEAVRPLPAHIAGDAEKGVEEQQKGGKRKRLPEVFLKGIPEGGKGISPVLPQDTD